MLKCPPPPLPLSGSVVQCNVRAHAFTLAWSFICEPVRRKGAVPPATLAVGYYRRWECSSRPLGLTSADMRVSMRERFIRARGTWGKSLRACGLAPSGVMRGPAGGTTLSQRRVVRTDIGNLHRRQGRGGAAPSATSRKKSEVELRIATYQPPPPLPRIAILGYAL